MDNTDVWRQAVDDELVTLQATVDTYATPKEAIRALIDWHVAVALDPAVSSDAQKLVASESAMDAESRRMFLARLETMQKDGHSWLSIAAVLALLNSCDFLASRS